jgi:monothiol glutaredoxin
MERQDGLLRQAFPDANEVSVVDRTGTGDHLQVVVASPRFEGLSLVEQHRLVYDALAEPLADGTIHELRIKTKGSQMSEMREKIQQVIADEPVVLFMKGTPQRAMCGNSTRALEALRRAGAPVTTVDILPDAQIRPALSALSGWPTIPQIFIRGELIGGADITEELAESGELEEKLESALGAGYRSSRAEKTVAVV